MSGDQIRRRTLPLITKHRHSYKKPINAMENDRTVDTSFRQRCRLKNRTWRSLSAHMRGIDSPECASAAPSPALVFPTQPLPDVTTRIFAISRPFSIVSAVP